MSKSVTQDMLYRQSIVKYALRHGATSAARKYRCNREYVYYWRRRYDGTVKSLAYKSRRPHSHANAHTEAEIKLITDMRRKNKHDGLVVFWVKLMLRDYRRSITGLWKHLRRTGEIVVKLPNPKYKPKPYQQMTYPGERVQVDVKYVPSSCLEGGIAGKKFFQYTALDEYSRFRYVAAFEENSTYSASLFAEQLIKAFKFKIECIQTDNGTEFTNRFTQKKDRKNLFELTLEKHAIRHKLIKPYTPRHNGKVERSHRKDNEYFYARKTFSSFEDFKEKLRKHNIWYNKFPMRPLGWKSPKHTLEYFFTQSVRHV